MCVTYKITSKQSVGSTSTSGKEDDELTAGMINPSHHDKPGGKPCMPLEMHRAETIMPSDLSSKHGATMNKTSKGKGNDTSGS